MKGRILCTLLLIFGLGSVGCSPPVPCSEGDNLISQFMGDIMDCETLGMVCNEAVGFGDACNEFFTFLEDMATMIGGNAQDFMPDVCGMFSTLDGFGLLGEVGTCHVLGETGDPCIDSADCENTCLEDGFCE